MVLHSTRVAIDYKAYFEKNIFIINGLDETI